MNLNLSTATRWGLHGLILLSLSLALYLGRQIFIPTTIAVLFACMLSPVVQWLNRRGLTLPGLGLDPVRQRIRPLWWRCRIPWSLACTAAISVLVIFVLGTAVACGLAVPRLLQSLPDNPRKAQEVYSRFRDRLEQLSPWELNPHYLPELAEESAAVRYIQNALDPERSQFVINALIDLSAIGGSWLWQSLLILFLLFFLLLEGRMLVRRLVELVGPGASEQARAVVALGQIADAVRAFLVWRTIINGVMAVVLGLLYSAAGLGQAWSWALLTLVLLYVPYLGPILAGIPPVLDAFVSCPSPLAALAILLFYVGFVTLEGYFIVPLVMGRSMDLNATTVMLACLYWELVWGPAGLLLAMPMMAAIKAICFHVPEWRPWANLMDTRDDAPPTDEAGSPPVEAERRERAGTSS